MTKTIPTTVGILIILLVAGLAGASFLFFGQEDEDVLSLEKDFYETDEVAKEDDVEIEKEDEFADWNTYKNEEYGFKFRYPKNWQLDLEGLPRFISLDVNGDNFLTEEEYRVIRQKEFDFTISEEDFEIMWQSFDSRWKYYDDIVIKIYSSVYDLAGNQKEGLSLDDWIEKRMNDNTIVRNSKKEVAINNYNGIEVVESGKTGWRSIFLIHNSVIYNFYLQKERPLEEMHNFDQILSTFQLLD